MSLPVNQLSPDLCATGQLSPEAMSEVAAAGFRSVINNRPDFEGGPDQPTSAAIEAAAHAAGLEYRFLPVNGAHQTPEEIAQFGTLLAELPRPILAFCRSGGRVAKLFQQAKQA